MQGSNKYVYTQNINLAVKVELAGYRIHKKLICPEHFTDNTERKYFCSALKRRLSNKVIYSKEIWCGRSFAEIIAVFPESSTGSQSILSEFSFQPKSK